MPPRKNDAPHRHAEPKPARTRKSKPKFELPAETAAAATQDVGWVYRADEELPPVDIKETVAEVAADVRRVPPAELADEAVLSTGKPAEPLPPLPPLDEKARGESASAASLAIFTGLSVFALGILTTGLISIAALSLMSAPVRMARRFLTTD